MPPLVEKCFHGVFDLPKGCEVAIMSSFSPNELPDPFDGIEFWAVGRHEFQRKTLPAFLAPCRVEPGVVVADVVNDEHHSPSRVRADAPQALEKSKESLAIELAFLPAVNELPVPEPDRPEVSDAFSGRVVKHDRVFDLRRYPHATPRTVLLKPHFVHSPQVHPPIPSQRVQFFYIQPGGLGLRGQFWDAACACEIQAVEKFVGTASRQGRCPSDAE